MPEISVIVRSHNDETRIGKTLEALTRQTVGEVEIIAADDYSTDRTKEIIRQYPPVHLLNDLPVPYVPGKTLNAAIRRATGKIIVFNNSDAIPQKSDYLEQLVRPLADESVGAVYGNQLSRPDAEPLVRKDSERAFGDGVLAASWGHFFSLATSAARAEILQKYSFDETLQYSEDVEWAYRLKKAGLKVIYVPEATVEHSHNYTPEQLWKRFYNEGRAEAAIFHRKPSLPTCMRQVLMESLRDVVYLVKHGEFRSICAIPSRRWRQKYGTYCGIRDYLREFPSK